MATPIPGPPGPPGPSQGPSGLPPVGPPIVPSSSQSRPSSSSSRASTTSPISTSALVSSSAPASPNITPPPATTTVPNDFGANEDHSTKKISMDVVGGIVGALVPILIILALCYFRKRARQKKDKVPLPPKRSPIVMDQRRRSQYGFQQTAIGNKHDSFTSPILSQNIPGNDSPTHLSFHSTTGSDLNVNKLVHARNSSFISTLVSTPVETPSEEKNNNISQSGLPPVERPFARQRPLSVASIASRHSVHSLGARSIGQGSPMPMRGAPHNNYIEIKLPQPLAPGTPRSRPQSLYSVPPGFISPYARPSTPSQGSIPHPRNMSMSSRDRLRDIEWEGSSEQPMNSSSALYMQTSLPHSRSAPGTINYRHSTIGAYHAQDPYGQHPLPAPSPPYASRSRNESSPSPLRRGLTDSDLYVPNHPELTEVPEPPRTEEDETPPVQREQSEKSSSTETTVPLLPPATFAESEASQCGEPEHTRDEDLTLHAQKRLSTPSIKSSALNSTAYQTGLESLDDLNGTRKTSDSKPVTDLGSRGHSGTPLQLHLTS